MTTLLKAPTPSNNLWSTMPGWGIVADLTPPELTAARGLRVLRKYIALALVIVALMCVAGYVWAMQKVSSANDQLSAANAQAQQLARDNAKYGNVVALQDTTRAVTGQISTLMAHDVDVATFVARLYETLPVGSKLLSANVSFNATSTVDATSLSTDPVIGTVTLTGTSRRMVDVAPYVTALQHLAGIVNVVPSSNSEATHGTGATWTLTLQVTDKLYSHQFDATSSAGSTGTSPNATPSGGHR